MVNVSKIGKGAKMKNRVCIAKGEDFVQITKNKKGGSNNGK